MKFDQNNLVLDKILTIRFGYSRCPKCDFDNDKSLDICPNCGQELLIYKDNALTNDFVIYCESSSL